MGRLVSVCNMRGAQAGAVQRAGTPPAHKSAAQESQGGQEGFCGNADTCGRDDDRLAHALLTETSRLRRRVSYLIVRHRSALPFDCSTSACCLSCLPDDLNSAL